MPAGSKHVPWCTHVIAVRNSQQVSTVTLVIFGVAYHAAVAVPTVAVMKSATIGIVAITCGAARAASRPQEDLRRISFSNLLHLVECLLMNQPVSSNEVDLTRSCHGGQILEVAGALQESHLDGPACMCSGFLRSMQGSATICELVKFRTRRSSMWKSSAAMACMKKQSKGSGRFRDFRDRVWAWAGVAQPHPPRKSRLCCSLQ